MSGYEQGPPSCCTSSSSSSSDVTMTSLAGLKLYQAFIFSLPIVFTFVLLFIFYLFYLRRRRANQASLRSRTPFQDNAVVPRLQFGLKKELREMLPIIVYMESFSVKDTQCPVCLGDYQAEDRLQQIPACGHTFHMDCIDHWLANHTTCPLCRLSLLASSKAAIDVTSTEVESGPAENNGELVCEELGSMSMTEMRDRESSANENSAEEEERRPGLQNNDDKEVMSHTRIGREDNNNS